MSQIPESGPIVKMSVSTFLFHPRRTRKGAQSCPLSLITPLPNIVFSPLLLPISVSLYFLYILKIATFLLTPPSLDRPFTPSSPPWLP